MFKILTRILALTCAIQAFSEGIRSQSEARDLTDVLAQGFVFRAQGGGFLGVEPGKLNSIADFSDSAKAIAPAFSAAIAQAITQDFPFASVAPAFIYRLNPSVDIFERFTGVPGPLFSERALTLGKGQLNFGVGYSFIDYSDFNGKSLDNLTSPGLFTEIPDEEPIVAGSLPTGETLYVFPYVLSQIRTRIDLNAHVVTPTVRYGITDRLDISVAFPIVSTFLRVRNQAVRTGDIAARVTEDLRVFDPAGNEIDLALPSEELRPRLFQFVKSRRPAVLLSRAAGNATGLGDIMLRTKYQFWQNGYGGGALGLNLQLPTGEARDFHGTEQTHLLTFLYLSQVFKERFEPHLNLGIDFNADDVDRSSFLYAVGGTFRIGNKLGVMVDFLGRSEFERLSVRVRQDNKLIGGLLDKSPASCSEAQTCRIAKEVTFSAVPIKLKRNDIANFSFGLRYVLGTGGSIFFGGIVPLNEDGFRADFIPTGGIEYTF